MMDKERSAKSLKTTDGFIHHKLKVCVQVPEESPASQQTKNEHHLFLQTGKNSKNSTK